MDPIGVRERDGKEVSVEPSGTGGPAAGERDTFASNEAEPREGC